MLQGLDGLGKVFQDVEQQYHSGGLRCHRPALAKVVEGCVLDPATGALVDGFGQQVEAMNAKALILETSEVSSPTHPTHDKQVVGSGVLRE